MDVLTPALQELSKKLGIPCTCRKSGPTWNGKDLDIARAKDQAWVTHEFAHFLVAKEPKLPNYGLGGDPDGGSWIDQVLSDKECDAEEEAACIGGVLLLMEIGESDIEIRRHVFSYSVHAIENRKTRRIYERFPEILKKCGSLDRLLKIFEDQRRSPYCCPSSC